MSSDRGALLRGRRWYLATERLYVVLFEGETASEKHWNANRLDQGVWLLRVGLAGKESSEATQRIEPCLRVVIHV